MPLYGPNQGGGGGSGDFPLSASFVLTSPTGSVPGGRVITAGPGVVIQDNGPGATVVVSATTTSSFITPTQIAETLFAATPGQFLPSVPITTRNGWLVNDVGYLLVSASL